MPGTDGTVLARERRVVWAGRGLPAQDGDGVKLTRIIGQPGLPDLDPFLMLDEFCSDDPGAYIGGFPDHPHRGFETVTYMLAGRMRHRDNKGNEGLLTAGSAQWMTAGRGLVHSEMPEQESGLMRGFQLWVNLPAARKMTEPRYQDIPPDAIPEVALGQGARARVIAGAVGDVTGPVRGVVTEPLFIDLHLDPGASASLAVPEGHAAFAYVFEGAARIGDAADELAQGVIGVLSDGGLVRVGSGQGARLILVAGRPLREPVAKYGPFVMSNDQELRQAFADFRAGKF